ncbi:Uncharacterized protein TCM_029427 [Theobroma cacao]|uniref:Secreted protein n=1 Tax=Theobroma cacao TaxID=3641 RepID=A0A061GDJ7_THECC|nr:Uncharacterized protein TCM_029427 [Theobroma cacao]
MKEKFNSLEALIMWCITLLIGSNSRMGERRNKTLAPRPPHLSYGQHTIKAAALQLHASLLKRVTRMHRVYQGKQ